MSRKPLTCAAAAALVVERVVLLYEQAEVMDAKNSAYGYVFRRMLDGLIESIKLAGIPEVALSYKQWADLANLAKQDGRRGGKWTDAGALRKPFSDWRDGVYGDGDAEDQEPKPVPKSESFAKEEQPRGGERTKAGAQQPESILVRVSVFTPNARGVKGGKAGMRCAFERAGGAAVDVERVKITPNEPLPLEAEVRRALEARRVRESTARTSGALLEVLRVTGGRAAKGFKRFCSHYKVPLLVLLAALVTLGACMAAHYAWVRFFVRPTRVHERIEPIPPVEEPQDRKVGVLHLSGEGGDWSGNVEIRHRSDTTFLFIYTPTVPKRCPDAAQQLSYAWRFNGGMGLSDWEFSPSTQILHRFPSQPTLLTVQLVHRCGANYSAEMPGTAPGSSMTIKSHLDAQGRPTFEVDAKVRDDQPIPGATVVPATHTTPPP